MSIVSFFIWLVTAFLVTQMAMVSGEKPVRMIVKETMKRNPRSFSSSSSSSSSDSSDDDVSSSSSSSSSSSYRFSSSSESSESLVLPRKHGHVMEPVTDSDIFDGVEISESDIECECESSSSSQSDLPQELHIMSLPSIEELTNAHLQSHYDAVLPSSTKAVSKVVYPAVVPRFGPGRCIPLPVSPATDRSQPIRALSHMSLTQKRAGGRSDAQAPPTEQERNLRSSKNKEIILGGENADIRQHPYQAQLLVDGEFWCGASIINEKWVVTAAHCLLRSPQYSRQIRVGSALRNKGGSIHNVLYTVTHWLYNKTLFDYDVALVRVSDPFVFSDTVQPIALADRAVDDVTQARATASAWGHLIGGNGRGSDKLQRLSTRIIPTAECQEFYNHFNVTITPRMICAGVQEAGDFCQGDSGGPLALLDKLVGVVSFGVLQCTTDIVPGVYANIAEVQRWIMTVASI